MSFINMCFVSRISVLGLSLLASFDFPAYTSEHNPYKENNPQVLVSKRSANTYSDSKQPKLKKSKSSDYGDIVEDLEKVTGKSSISSDTSKINITSKSRAHNKNIVSNTQNGRTKNNNGGQSIFRTPSYKETRIVPKKDIFYDKFCNIMKKSPNPVTEPLQKITAEDEDRDGSRKWVKQFSSQESSIHSWHQNSAKIITLMWASVSERRKSYKVACNILN